MVRGHGFESHSSVFFCHRTQESTGYTELNTHGCKCRKQNKGILRMKFSQNTFFFSTWCLVLIFEHAFLFRTVRIWDFNNPKRQKDVVKFRSLQGRKTVPTCCAFSRDAKLIAAPCQDGTLQLWDVKKPFVSLSIGCHG